MMIRLTVLVLIFGWFQIKSGRGEVLVPASLPGSGGSVRGIETYAPASNAGTFDHTIPFEVSPGRNGVQPGLSLQYSSGHGDDVVGMGWDFGVPSIQHHPRRVPDYAGNQPEYFSSEFGELVSIGQSYFRPLRGAGSRLFLKTKNEQWIQWDHNGNRKIFGDGVARVGSKGSIYRWNLSNELDSTCKSENDPDCNRIEYRYRGGFDAQPSPYPFRNSQIYLESIDYNFVGGRPLSTIHFGYGRRPVPILSLRSGFEVLTDRLLESIVVETAGKTVWEYGLQYENNGFSYLSRLSKKGRNGFAYPEITFNYSGTEQRRVSRRAVENLPLAQLSGKFAATNYIFTDVDGDSRADVYWHKDGQALVAFNRTAPGAEKITFDKPKKFSKDAVGVLERYASFFADVDGDGILDWVDTSGIPKVRINRRTEWSDAIPGLRFPEFQLKGSDSFLLDINGDGLVDVLKRSPQKDICYLNSGDQQGWSQTQVAARGERPDVEISSLSGRTRVGDINGDGLSDFIFLGQNEIKVWLNRGNCSWSVSFAMGIPKSLNFDLKTQAPEVFYVADVDGDGLDDLLEITKTGISWSQNSGEGALREADLLGGKIGTVNQLFIGDADGDGLKDVGYCNVEGGCAFLGLADPQKPGLLTHIETQLGEYWDVDYQPSPSFYSEEWNTKVPFTLQVPAQVIHGDSLYEKTISRFFYRNLYFDSFDRRFNGFGEINSVRQAGHFEERITQPDISTKRIYSLGQRQDATDQSSSALAGRVLIEERGEFRREYSYKFQSAPDCAPCRVLSEIQDRKIEQQNGLFLGTQRISYYDTIGNPLEEKLYDISSFKTQLQSSTFRKFISTARELPSRVTDIVQSLIEDETKKDRNGKLISNAKYTYTDPEVGEPASENIYLNEGQRLRKTFEYDKVHPKNRTRTSDSDGRLITRQGFDESGINLAETTNGEGEKKFFRYDPGTGVPLWEMDNNGLRVEHNYNDRGEETNRVTKHGTQIYGRMEWSRIDGKKSVPTTVTEMTQVDGSGKNLSKVSFLNPAGELLQRVEDGPGSTVRTVIGKEYDSNGKLARDLLAPIFARNFGYSPSAFGHFPHRDYDYDVMDRVNSIKFPLVGTSDTYRYSVERQGIDLIRRRVSIFDRHRNRNQIDHWYDGLDRLVGTSYHTSNKTTDDYLFAYNDANHLIEIVFPEGARRQFHWNGQGLLDYMNDSRLGSLALNYDFRGRLANRVWSNQIRETTTYDQSDRKLSVVRAESGVAREDVISYVYGKNAETYSIGLPESIQYSWGRDEFTYTPDGKIWFKKRILALPGLTKQFDVHYRFDWLAQPRMVKSGKRELRYLPDDHGFLKSIPGVVENVRYDARVEPLEIQLANGVVEKRLYDPSTWRLEQLSMGGIDEMSLTENYTYDEIGNLLTKKRSHVARNPNPANSWEAIYAYDDRDPRYRLIKFDQENTHERFTYDPVGKRTGENFEKRFGAIQYDEIGRVRAAAHFRSLGYNSASQLELAQTASGKRPVKFLYDHDKEILAKLIDGRVSAVYVDRALEWTPPTGESTEDEPIFHVFMGNRPVSSVDYRKKKQQFFHADHLGSVILVTDELKRPLRLSSYTPYGEIITGPPSAGDFAFAGGRYDSDTLLYQMGVRHYDPAMGQFLTPDPLASEQPLKLLLDPVQLFPYQYARDNPLTYIDPTGRAAQLVGAAIAGGVELGLQTALLVMQQYSQQNVTWGDVGIAAGQVGLSAAAGGTVAGMGVRFASWSKSALDIGHLTKASFFASNIAVGAASNGVASAMVGAGANLLAGRPPTHDLVKNASLGIIGGSLGAGIGFSGAQVSKQLFLSQTKPYQHALADQMDFFTEQFASSMGKWDAFGFSAGAISEKALGAADNRARNK